MTVTSKVNHLEQLQINILEADMFFNSADLDLFWFFLIEKRY